MSTAINDYYFFARRILRLTAGAGLAADAS